MIHTVIPGSKAGPALATPTGWTPKATEVLGQGLQPAWNLLAGLDNQLNHVLGEVTIFVVEEGGGKTQVAHATSTSNSVDVLFNVRGQVKINDMFNVGNVESSSCNL
jgi:hypothetical protein